MNSNTHIIVEPIKLIYGFKSYFITKKLFIWLYTYTKNENKTNMMSDRASSYARTLDIIKVVITKQQKLISKTILNVCSLFLATIVYN